MPSLLDRFVIDIALDTKKVAKGAKDAQVSLKGLNDAAQKSGTALADSGKAMADGFSKARNEALALMAVFTGGRSLKAFTSEVTRTNSALGYTAQQLNVRPQNLSVLKNMLKAIGGNASDAESSIGALQQKAMDPQQMATLNKAFGQLHVQNWKELLHSPTELFRALNIGTQGMDQTLKNNRLNQVGISGSSIDLIDQTTSSFDDLAKAMQQAAPTDDQIAHSQQLQKDWNTLKITSEALGNAMLDKVVPGLDGVIKEFIALEKSEPEAIATIAGITAAVLGLGTAVKGALAIRGLAQILSGLKSGGGLCECECGPGGGAGKTAKEAEEVANSERGKPGRVPQKSPPKKIPIKPPSITEDTAGILGFVKKEAQTYLTKEEARDVAELVLKQGGLKMGTKMLPIIGQIIALATPIDSGQGEGTRIDNLRKKGAFGKFGFGIGPYEQYKNAVAKIEGARYDQMGGFQQAYAGKYQMSRDAITDAAHWLKESVPSTAQFLKDPAMQERYFRAHTDQNFKYLMGHSDIFRADNEMQRLAILAYAHNQGAGGAARWLRTGQAGSDGFGTSGTAYSDAVTKALNTYDNARVQPAMNHSVHINGDIQIHTNATDAQGIARDIHTALATPSQLAHGNARGLQ